MIKHAITILFSGLFTVLSPLALADAYTPELVWEASGFSNPESAVYDTQLNHLYVSNVNGAPDAKDNNGFISIVSMDGRIINEKWMIGLNAPKGLAMHGRHLYVADIDELVVINVDRGRILARHKVDDAKFLNDVTAAENGDVFVSDMVLNRIHVLSGDEFSIWLESEELENPNGLHFTEDDIVVGSWGKMTDGFATDVPGHMKRVSMSTRNISSFGDGSPIGNLDGVEGNDDIGYYVTDWLNGGLFYIKADGTTTKLLDLPQGSADHEYVINKGMIYLPMMKDNTLRAYKISQ